MIERRGHSLAGVPRRRLIALIELSFPDFMAREIVVG